MGWTLRCLALCGGVFSLVLAGGEALGQQKVPDRVNVQGVLRNVAGDPVTGAYSVTFRLYPSATSPTILYQSTQVLDVNGGVFNTYIGPLDSAMFGTYPDIHLGIQVGTDPELPRRPFASIGYAMYADRARYADNANMGPASDLTCTDCVDGSEIADNPELAGDLYVTGSVISCTANATGCGVRVSTESGIFDYNDGQMMLQSVAGVTVRNRDNTGWSPFRVGPITGYGVLNLPAVGLSIDTGAGGAASLSLPATGELRLHAYAGQASFRVDGSIYVDENSGLYVTGPANLAVNAGSVGVGTGSPKSKLDVRGALRLDKAGTNDDANLLFRANYPDSWGWKFSARDYGGGIDLDIWGSNDSDGWTKWATFSNQSTSGRSAFTVHGNLDVRGNLVMTGGRVLGTTLFDGGAGATTLFSKAEGAGKLRVGAAWGMPGIYSGDDGGYDIVMGMPAGQKAKIGTSPKFVEVDSDGNLCIPAGATIKTCGQTQQQPTCDGTVRENYCYKFFNQTGVCWSQAEAACVQWGGHLVSIHSQAERDFVYNLGCCGGGVWLGAHDNGHEGSWTWTDGSPWDWSAWNGGEPNNCCGGENYLEGHWCGNANWNDVGDCNTDNCYVCKKPLAQASGLFSSSLSCTTIYGAGSAGGCWGVSYVYCPTGYVMTGGGMSEPNLSFEQSRPCTDQEGQCWVCDNYPGCGNGTCWVRCCKVQTAVAGGTPRSCKEAKEWNPAASSGRYRIDPDGDGGVAPFDVYCDMSADGGGWTLVMKIDANSNRFVYHSAYWENDDLYNEASTDMNPTDAKFRSFTTLAFNQIRVGMQIGGTTNWMNIAKTANSLKAVMQGGYQSFSYGRAAWEALVPGGGSLQYNCSLEGFNTYTSCMWDTGPSGVARVRIGIVANQEGDCCSTDSRIGFGGGGAYCGQDPNNACGNEATCPPIDRGERHTRAHGFIFVR